MKIKTTITEIECTANELRQSNALADGFFNMLRGCFNNMTTDCDDGTEEQEDCESEGEQEDGKA